MASLKTRFQKIAEGKTTLGFDPLANDTTRLAQLSVKNIVRDPHQPRKDLGDITDLKNSIQEHGIVQPIVVSPLDSSRYLLIAGERRLTATVFSGHNPSPRSPKSCVTWRRSAAAPWSHRLSARIADL